MPSDEESETQKKLLETEEKFTSKLGTAETCCRCLTLKSGVQVCAILVILNALMHFQTSFARTGAPCYYWWKHWATTVTFVMGHAARLIMIPFAVIGLIGARKGQDAGPRMFFFALLALAACGALDLVLCIFEVHQVCASQELHDWNICAHNWGKNQFQCAPIDNSTASATACAAADELLLENDATTGVGSPDFAICTGVGAGNVCQHIAIPKAQWIKPDCCVHEELWSHDKGPCSREPRERVAEFDVLNCELISDLYDVTLGVIGVVFLLFCARVVNSYRAALAEESEEPID